MYIFIGRMSISTNIYGHIWTVPGGSRQFISKLQWKLTEKSHSRHIDDITTVTWMTSLQSHYSGNGSTNHSRDVPHNCQWHIMQYKVSTTKGPYRIIIDIYLFLTIVFFVMHDVSSSSPGSVCPNNRRATEIYHKIGEQAAQFKDHIEPTSRRRGRNQNSKLTTI